MQLFFHPPLNITAHHKQSVRLVSCFTEQICHNHFHSFDNLVLCQISGCNNSNQRKESLLEFRVEGGKKEKKKETPLEKADHLLRCH
jgi:hypothetical protein